MIFVARGMFGYAPRTVSYARKLTSVYMCYSQGNEFDLILPCQYSTRSQLSVGVKLLSGLLLFCSLVRSCPTSGDVNEYHVCTLPTSTRINRPPHPDHLAHAQSPGVNQQPLWGMLYADDAGVVLQSLEQLRKMMGMIVLVCAAFGLIV